MIWSIFKPVLRIQPNKASPRSGRQHAAAAVHEDAVGVDCERHHPRAGLLPAHAVEESKGEGGAICDARGRGCSTGESGKEAVQGALGDRGGLTKQFVEHVVCVISTERACAHTLCGRGKGVAGRPGR